MASEKLGNGLPPEPSQVYMDTNGAIDRHLRVPEGDAKAKKMPTATGQEGGNLLQLLICVGGIYVSFISWAFLQERLTTTAYGPKEEKFKYAVFLNTVQSAFAAITGSAYLLWSSSRAAKPMPIFPSRAIFQPLALVAITSSLGSPFGYAALKHVDYITFILAKSCKLLPVMLLHITWFRKRYPLHKYAVVAAITLGVAIFTLHTPSKKGSSKKKVDDTEKNAFWGLFLLFINLLFDGITNSTQDYIFQTFKPYSGPQMMCAANIMSTILTSGYLLSEPYLAASSVGRDWLGMSSVKGGELQEALAFATRYPAVGWDVLMFAACGAFGQIFIYYTLSQFSSILLVTVTVTRKMLTMIFSVVWFGHRVQGMQWLGIGLVFGGVGTEGYIERQAKMAKEAEKKRLDDEKKKEL